VKFVQVFSYLAQNGEKARKFDHMFRLDLDELGLGSEKLGVGDHDLLNLGGYSAPASIPSKAVVQRCGIDENLLLKLNPSISEDERIEAMGTIWAQMTKNGNGIVKPEADRITQLTARQIGNWAKIDKARTTHPRAWYVPGLRPAHSTSHLPSATINFIFVTTFYQITHPHALAHTTHSMPVMSGQPAKRFFCAREVRSSRFCASDCRFLSMLPVTAYARCPSAQLPSPFTLINSLINYSIIVRVYEGGIRSFFRRVILLVIQLCLGEKTK